MAGRSSPGRSHGT